MGPGGMGMRGGGGSKMRKIIVRVIKSRGLRREGHVVRMEEDRNVFKAFNR